MLYASASNVLSALASGATAGMYLRNGGASTAPLWSTLILPNAATANRIAYASATNTYGASANLTFNGTNLTCAGQVFGTVQLFRFKLPGTQTVGTNKMGAQTIIPFACTIVKAYANAGTAPTGAGLIFDINYDSNGGVEGGASTIWSTKANRLTIAAAGATATTTTFNTTSLAAGGTLTFDVDQIGSTIAGSDVEVVLVTRHTGTY